MLGVPSQNKYGEELLGTLQINLLSDFIHRTFANVTKEEFILALEFAIQQVTNDEGKKIDLNLYGTGFSVAYVTKIVKPYIMYRNKLKRDHDAKTGMRLNISEQGQMPGISDDQFSELKGNIDKIGKTSEELKKEARIKAVKDIKLDNEDNWQIWMQEFDELVKYTTVKGGNGLFIDYAGKIVNMTEYCEMRFKELKNEQNK